MGGDDADYDDDNGDDDADIVLRVIDVMCLELQLADTLGSPRGSPVPRRHSFNTTDDDDDDDDDNGETDSLLIYRRDTRDMAGDL